MNIKIENLDFSYFEDSSSIISDLSAEFNSDEITVLTGISGCGKSTLLYLAAGLYPHNAGFLRSGKILVEGTNPDKITPEKRSRYIGMMFQNPELQFCMDTVENEMLFCLENICIDSEEIDKRMDEALEFCGVIDLKKRKLVSLSGGERQKVMLACIVELQPKWILLDEPFANIDDESARIIAGKLKSLHEDRGTGILAVDHRLDNWINIADRLMVMADGSIYQNKISKDSINAEELEQLGIIVPGHSYKPNLMTSDMGKPILEIKHLSLSHSKREILRDVNVTFKRGGIYALLGQSGCGKSSLFGALSGMYRYKGDIIFEGKSMKKQRKSDRGKIGFVTQNPQDQFVGSTVQNELTKGHADAEKAEKRSRKILKEIGLWKYREISQYMLSQGQQRRLGVAALMMYDCHMLVCDEPTYAQDRNSTMTIMDRLCKMAREKNIALVFSTHDKQLAADYADEIFELKDGVLNAYN